MDPGRQDYTLALGDLILRRHKVGDDEHLDRVACLGLAKGRPSQSILAVLGQAHTLQHQDAV